MDRGLGKVHRSKENSPDCHQEKDWEMGRRTSTGFKQHASQRKRKGRLDKTKEIPWRNSDPPKLKTGDKEITSEMEMISEIEHFCKKVVWKEEEIIYITRTHRCGQ